jgi:hypothetical protein
MLRAIWGGAIILSAIFAVAPARASQSPGGLWLSLSAEWRHSSWLSEWGGFVTLNVPFDRVAAQSSPRGLPRLAEEPPKKESASTPVPVAPARKRESPLLLLNPRLARATVRHALAFAGYSGTRARLRSLSARARSSGALPELRLRSLRSTGETLRLTPSTDDPYRYTQAGASELLFEARLTWHLDRLLFSDQEVSLERLRSERDAAEQKLVEHVLERLAAWQRERVRAADEDSEPEVRENAELEALGAAVELDVLTDGWFSEAIGDGDEPAPPDPGKRQKLELDTPAHAR